MKRRNAGSHAAVVGSLQLTAAAASIQRVRTGVTISASGFHTKVARAEPAPGARWLRLGQQLEHCVAAALQYAPRTRRRHCARPRQHVAELFAPR